MRSGRTLFVITSVIFFGLVSGINDFGRKRKIPYDPDRRIPVRIPESDRSVPDDWNRLDSGKYLRSLDRELGKSKNRISTSRGPDSVPGLYLYIVNR